MINITKPSRLLATMICLLALTASAFSQTTSVVKTFNSSGSIVFGAGVQSVDVSMWGGGGGGSAGGMKQYTNAVDYILHYGGGGGGSNWAGKSLNVTSNASYNFTVGSGGAGGGFDGDGNPMSGGNGSQTYFMGIASYGGFGGIVSGYNGVGGARAPNSIPDPGLPYAQNGKNESTTTGGNGGLSNSGPYGPSGVNVSLQSGLGYPQVQGISTGGPGTRPGDGGGGGGFTTLPFPFMNMLATRKAGGNGANGVITFYISYPTYRLTEAPTSGKLCGPGTPAITIRSSALYGGIYTVTYNTSNPVTTGNTAVMVFNGATGVGSFTGIPITGTSTFTITNLASGTTCSDAITANNSVTVVVENNTANSWNTHLDFSGTGRSNAASFTIGNKVYVGTGKNGATVLNDFWQFDPATNAWTQLADFAGGVRTDAVGMAIGTKGYIGTGSDGTNLKNDFWEYDPFTNIWSAKAAFSGGLRTGAAGFGFSRYGYIGTGYNGSAYQNDLWRYDPQSNSWISRASLPGAARSLATGFTIHSKGYVAMGSSGAALYNDLWEYHTENNSWSLRSAFPGAARSGAAAFTIGNKGYIGTGWNGTTALADFYEFDPYFNTWATKAAFSGPARRHAVAFNIGSKGFIGLGMSGSSYYKTVYEYSPTNTSIITGAVPGTAFCIGSSFVIPFSVGCMSAGANNVYMAVLSDSSGSFATTYSVGSSTSAGGSINVTIPSYVPPGSRYRIKVMGSEPLAIGTDNGIDFAIKPGVTASVTAGINTSSICRGESIDLNASVSTPATSDTTVILSENFNNGAASWLMTNTNSFQFGITGIYSNGERGFYSNDNSSFYLTSSSGRFSYDFTNTVLQSPVFSTLGMNSGSLSFWQCYQYGGYNNSDSIRVQISTNNGQSWSTIYLNNTHNVGDPQDSTGFQNQVVSLDNFMNLPSVVLRFNYGAHGGMGRWMLDNIVVKGVSKSNNFSWTSTPGGFTSTLQNPTGVVPTASTVYSVAYSNNYGCGSVANSVSVTVREKSTSTTSLSICPADLPFVWNGLTFNGGGSQVKHLVNAAGCDSAATLILTIKANSTSTTNISICPSELPYSWNGLVFTGAGAQTAHFINSVGCDSAATLVLNLKPNSTFTQNLTLCESALPYEWNGLTFHSAGSQTMHFTNSIGCDSAITLNLTTVSPLVGASSNVTSICAGALVSLSASAGSGSAVTILNEKFNSSHNNWTATNLSSGGLVNNAAWTLRPHFYNPYFGLPEFRSNDNSQFYLSDSYSQGTAVTTHTVLESPVFSTVGLSTASLSFFHHFSHQNNFANDSIRVQVSPDGTNWMTLYVNKAQTVGTSEFFQPQNISLSGYLNQPSLRLRFVYNGTPIVGGYSNYWWAIDNISVNGTLQPNNFNWTSNPAGFTSTVQNPPAFSPAQTTTYTVSVYNGFCITQGSVTIKMNTANPSSSTDMAICPSALPYTWNGLLFNAAGSQTAHIMTAGGCDSSATLNLTLKATSSSVTNITICPSGLPYTWNGLVFNAAGSQTKHLTNSVGCDSAAVLNLFVQTSSTSSVTTITICDSELPYTWNGLVFTGAGRQVKMLTNSYGCDSAATLNLIVSTTPANVVAGASSVSVCAGSTVDFTASSIGNTILLDENFNDPTNNWVRENLSTGGTPSVAAWTLRSRGYLLLGAILVQSNDASQFYLSDSYSQGSGSNTNTFLQSPAFNTMGYSTASLTYYQVYMDQDATDAARVQVSTDNGTTWTTVLNRTTSSGGYSAFVQETVSLNAYVNMPSVMIRFNYVATNDVLWGIDNVKVTGTPSPAVYSWSSVPEGFTSQLQNPSGISASQSAVYTVVASNANGCSDSASVAINVKAVSSSSTSLSICPSSLPYTWNGLTFNSAGSQTAHLLNSVGCDSAATLVLTVKAASSSSMSLSVCPSSLPYSWNGLVFNAAGTQTAHFTNAAGCDSAASLTLTLKAVSVSSTTQSICASALPYNWNGLTFNEAGTQTAHFENSLGCDSAASLTLIVNEAPVNVTAGVSSSSVCEGGSISLFASSTSSASGVEVVLLEENFNSTSSNWTTSNQSTGGTPGLAAWTLRPDEYKPPGFITMHSNDSSQFYLSNSDAQGAGHTITTLYSPVFSTVGYSSASLSFYHLYFNADPNYDFIKVQVSTDGVNWSNIYQSSSHVYGDTYTSFVKQTINLDAYVNRPNVRLRFNYDCFWGFRWAIDNVKITGSPMNTYSWSSSPEGFSSSLQNPTGVIPASSTVYTVTVMSANGCSVEEEVLVAVNAGPSASISYDASPCTSESMATVTHSGTTGGIYSGPAGLVINAVTGEVDLENSTPGTYVVNYTIAAAGTCPQYITNGSVTVASKYEMIVSAGSNGSISPASQQVNCGANMVYTITPEAGYIISDVLVDGVSVGAVDTYMISNIQSDHTISASFAASEFTITATAGFNGSISPMGISQVAAAGTYIYSITPSTCYHISDVLVDGVSVGAVSTYTFTNLSSNRTISATFEVNDPMTVPIVSGVVNVCAFEGTGEELSYAVSNINAGTTSYEWVVPSTVTIVSGQGTANLVIRINAGFAAAANKQIRVKALSTCAVSPQGIFYMVAQTAGTPRVISGNTNVCTILGSQSTFTYSIPPVAGASGYVWNATDPNVTITSVHGAGVNDTVITARFATGFATSAITVRAVNNCGVSGARSINITRNNPSTPGLINGSTNACAFMAPNGVAANYSIEPVAGAVTYNWAVPGNAVISGQGTTNISFMYPDNFISGNITVTASNGCGTSNVRTRAISRLNPGTASVIDVVQVQSCPVRIYSYTLSAMPVNANSVVWTVPEGATVLTGAGTSGITVSYPPTAISGTVTAQGINNCGTGSTRSSSVKLAACADDEPLSKGKPVELSLKGMSVSVYPNPTVTDFNLRVTTTQVERVQVRILDVQGRVYKVLSILPNRISSVGAELKAGAYFLEVTQGSTRTVKKVVKF